MTTTDYGLSSAGYNARRTEDIVDSIRARIEAETGETFDWTNDTLWGVITLVTAEEINSAEEALQAVYDARDRNNATGIQLDILGMLIGVPRNDASYSEGTVTLSGTVGTVITAGHLVEGGGPEGTSRWRLTEDVTIGTFGTEDGTIQAVDAGEIEAIVGEIDTIVTPVSGWNSVTNAAAIEDGAGMGQDREGDEDYRRRQEQSVQIRGSSSSASLLSALLDLDYITNAIVVENDTHSTATVSGLSLLANSIYVILYPQTTVATQLQEIAETIHGKLTSGIRTNGTGQTATVTKADGQTKTITWDWSTTTTVNVIATVELEAGYSVSDVKDGIEAVVEQVFDALSVGEPIYDLDIYKQLDDVAGLRRATVTLNGANTVTPDADEICDLGTVTVTT